MLSETKMGYFAKTNDYTPDFTKPQQVKIKMIYFMIIMHFLFHIYLFYNYASVYLGLFCVFFGGVCVVNWRNFHFWCLGFSLYTYQIIQHPHQRLKLQLTDFPLVLPSHVDSTRRGDGEHSWFVLLLVQHYKVVHTSSTRNGINLRTEGDRRELLLVAGGLRNAKINNTPLLLIIHVRH